MDPRPQGPKTQDPGTRDLELAYLRKRVSYIRSTCIYTLIIHGPSPRLVSLIARLECNVAMEWTMKFYRTASIEIIKMHVTFDL